MTYEQQAIAEALLGSSLAASTQEERERVAKEVVEDLHRQHFRLISDDVSFDD